MKPFLIIILLLIESLSFAQKPCKFSIGLMNNNLNLLTDSIRGIRLETFSKKKSIPKIIRQTLNCWTGNFDIANPNKPYQSSDAVSWRLKPLPLRQLVYLGFNNHYLILTYKKGGHTSSDNILIFKFDHKTILDCWACSGARISSQEEVLYFLENYRDDFQSGYLNL